MDTVDKSLPVLQGVLVPARRKPGCFSERHWVGSPGIGASLREGKPASSPRCCPGEIPWTDQGCSEGSARFQAHALQSTNC